MGPRKNLSDFSRKDTEEGRIANIPIVRSVIAKLKKIVKLGIILYFVLIIIFHSSYFIRIGKVNL